MPKRVLILCTGNSARSQMAEGLFRQEAGDAHEVFSAGTRPTQVRPEAIAVMQEIGIDISGHRSKSVDEFTGETLELVITSATTPTKPVRFSPAGRSGCIGLFKTRLQWRVQRNNEKPRSARSGIRFTQGSGPSWAIRIQLFNRGRIRSALSRSIASRSLDGKCRAMRPSLSSAAVRKG